MPDPSDRKHKPGAETITETDLAAEKMGRNSLQGDDQANVHNERKAVPDVKHKPDDVIESLETTDKDVRARRDLGKGRRHAPNHPMNKSDGTKEN